MLQLCFLGSQCPDAWQPTQNHKFAFWLEPRKFFGVTSGSCSPSLQTQEGPTPLQSMPLLDFLACGGPPGSRDDIIGNIDRSMVMICGSILFGILQVHTGLGCQWPRVAPVKPMSVGRAKMDSMHCPSIEGTTWSRSPLPASMILTPLLFDFRRHGGSTSSYARLESIRRWLIRFDGTDMMEGGCRFIAIAWNMSPRIDGNPG
jgi:hypothetical protein